MGGPRQVGKTTFALSLLPGGRADESHPAYMTWDDLADRQRRSQMSRFYGLVGHPTNP